MLWLHSLCLPVRASSQAENLGPDLGLRSAVTLLKALKSFEQGAPHFHLVLDPANSVAVPLDHCWINAGTSHSLWFIL